MGMWLALQAYVERFAVAQGRYREACKALASLSETGRVTAEIAAFKTLQREQQRAMRDLVTSEFTGLLALRQSLSEQPLPDPRDRHLPGTQ